MVSGAADLSQTLSFGSDFHWWDVVWQLHREFSIHRKKHG